MRQLKSIARSSAGFSLVELMIGIVVGLFLLIGLSSVYISSVRGGRTTTSANQLNQDMRALMDIMVNDLRRAGHWEAAVAGSPNPFVAPEARPKITALDANRSCILYSYDAPAAIGADHFGFQLNADGVVQATNPGSFNDTTTGCANAGWVDLTDEVTTQVTRLTFDTVGSKCLAINVANPATRVDWTTTSGNGMACVAGAPGAPSTFPDPATHRFVETRRVNIALEAASRIDPSLSVVLQESVVVRANRVIAP